MTEGGPCACCCCWRLGMSVSQPAFAQVDISGLWRPMARNQDGSGMTGDSAGLPLSPEGQWRAQSWSPEDFDTAEWVCRPHSFDYSLEGPLSALRLWADMIGPRSEIVAYRGHLNMMEQETSIWMDGRPHPPENAAAHVERFFDRRVGRRRAGRHDHAPQRGVHAAHGCDAQRRATVRTRWRRMGNYLQATSILYDPVYMTGTVRAQHDDVGLRPGAGRGALSVRGGHRDRRSAGQRAALPAGPEPAARV